MDIFDSIELNDCPICGGAGLLEEENQNTVYITCLDCGAHSVNMDYKNDEQKLTAAQKVAMLWNAGKVIKSEPGE